ncbi:hypothetical protein BDB00DRAFT_792290 [Zychaea mexicana]|uniref:uncharacterized protein n=1 Tax=Zychaea mexicana TaxID=64656 RepID=UPI0022FEAD4C|nr:uncharacterized protein BDB00DRAFT_792290 [Zychaea mexicana]KAI9487917.1 hypothetical protein BDB00DRAFT_792290 [Zychaea mexicana]
MCEKEYTDKWSHSSSYPSTCVRIFVALTKVRWSIKIPFLKTTPLALYPQPMRMMITEIDDHVLVNKTDVNALQQAYFVTFEPTGIFNFSEYSQDCLRNCQNDEALSKPNSIFTEPVDIPYAKAKRENEGALLSSTNVLDAMDPARDRCICNVKTRTMEEIANGGIREFPTTTFDGSYVEPNPISISVS